MAAAIQQWLLRVPELHVAGWLRAAAAKFNRVAAETAETEAMPALHLVSVAGHAAGGRRGLCAASAQEVPRGVRSRSSIPAAALATLRSDPSARIFTNDEWGDYLIYRLYPAHKVFVDGRSDFYGDDFEEKYIDVLNVKYGWEKILSRLRRRHDFNAPQRAAEPAR